MLFQKTVLEGIRSGQVTLAFRSWRRRSVVPGTRQLTPIGVVEIVTVDEVDSSLITDSDARAAGFEGASMLRGSLRSDDRAKLYRIVLRFAGADPRIALRNDAMLTADDITELSSRLARLDRATRSGPWTERVLRLIDAHPDGTRAADLAESIDVEKERLKLDIRKLKNLGLTESLGTGYRVSPRGHAWLQYIEANQRPTE